MVVNTRKKRRNSPLDNSQKIQYKDIELLKTFLSEHGKILPRRRTNLSVKQQKTLKKAVKRARVLSLLPFVLKDGV